MSNANVMGPGTPSQPNPGDPTPNSNPGITTPEVEIPTHRPEVDEPDASGSRSQRMQGMQQQQQPLDSIQDTPRHSTRGGSKDSQRGQQANEQQHGDTHQGGEGNGNQQRGGLHGGLQGNLSQDGKPVTGQPQIGQRQQEGLGSNQPQREQGDKTKLGLQGGLGKEEAGREYNENISKESTRPGTNTRHR